MNVEIDGKAVPLLSVRVNHARDWYDHANPETFTPVAAFDMDGEVKVRVIYPKGIKSAVVRPSRYGIVPLIDGNTVSFSITKTGQYSLEFNGNAEEDALMIFANPSAPEIPDGARVITGRHDGDITVNNGETLYLASGSVVYGQINMGSNSRLLGRGIICGSHLLSAKNIKAVNAIHIWDAENVAIEGVMCLDQNRWVIEIRNSSNITLDNVKIMSSRNNSDGITIQSSENILIRNCFIRSWDDSIVLKNYTEMNCRNITAKNCVIWTDLAQSLEIGFETNRSGKNSEPSICHILFEDIDILHNFHKAPISIHNCDACKVSDVTFRNIFVDDAEMGQPNITGEGWKYLIDFTNADSASIGGHAEWTHTNGIREISDITVEGLYVLGGKRESCGARFINEDCGGKSIMKNIRLKDIFFMDEALVFDNPY
jgi:hypothetical protein